MPKNSLGERRAPPRLCTRLVARNWVECETLGSLFTLDGIRVLRKSLTAIRVDRLGARLIIGYVGNSGKFVRFSKLYWSCVAEGLGGLDAPGEMPDCNDKEPGMEALTGAWQSHGVGPDLSGVGSDRAHELAKWDVLEHEDRFYDG